MKKRNTTICLFMMCCGLGLTACEEDPLGQSQIQQGAVAIFARMDGDLPTRTCVDVSSSDGHTGILWSPGDCIGVYGTASTKNARFEATNKGNVPEAKFVGSLASGESPAYAYYPYDEKNVASDVTAVRGTLKLEQTFNMTSGKLEGDYKVGFPTFKTYEGAYEFAFEHLFSLLKFQIDATGTDLEGDALEQIILTLPDGRRLGGAFTFDAATKEVIWADDTAGANILTMVWNDEPALTSGRSYTGYITCAPDIRKGDPIKITIQTRKYKAEFTRTALVDFAANTCYTFPLVLENFKNNMEVISRPVISSFSFEAAANTGKILDRKLTSNGNTTYAVSNTAEMLTIGDVTISGCIPYLYDFKLKPSFTVAEGLTVTVNGQTQTSGQSEQDFSKPVVYTVSDGTDSRDYTVTVTNSGLPIVVLTQSGGGSVYWSEAGINIRSKDSDWVETDKIAVYNADGTVDVAARDCGIRLRGNSTQNFPKKPFAIKLAKKTAVQGMPEHKRWVLLANWMDRTMLRNAVALEIARRVDNAYVNDGIGWSPRGCNVEVVMDGRHVGNYFLCEQIKIDGERVDIRDCYEDVKNDTGKEPTLADCGYLLEFDDNYDEIYKFRTGRGLPCMFKDELPATDLYNAVKYRVETIESNLESGDYTTAYGDLDINSLIDYFLIQELTLNDEYKHPKSVYMFFNGTDKLTAGPVWDFDWQTFVRYDQVEAMIRKYGGNTQHCRPDNEWLYGASSLSGGYDNDKPYMWYPLLFRDAAFRQAVQTRWPAIYSVLQTLEPWIGELADKNRLSDSYNYAMWPQIAKKQSGLSAFNGDEDMSFDEAVASLQKVFTDRLTWMNTQITSGVFVIDAE